MYSLLLLINLLPLSICEKRQHVPNGDENTWAKEKQVEGARLVRSFVHIFFASSFLILLKRKSIWTLNLIETILFNPVN